MTGRRQEAWGDTERERAKALWKDGLTATQIGERMGRSRSSVLGLINRLGLQRSEGCKAASRAITSRTRPPKPPKPLPAPKVRAVPPPTPEPIIVAKFTAEPVPDTLGVDILQLGIGRCKYVLGQTGGGIARYCGQGCLANGRGGFRSYCAGHGGDLIAKAQPRKLSYSDFATPRQISSFGRGGCGV